MICPSGFVRIPLILLRVVCGFGETMASLVPMSALNNVDLPTLGRPSMLTEPVLEVVLMLRESDA